MYYNMDTASLIKKRCVPCEKGTPPLPPEKVQEFLQAVTGWELIEGKAIRKAVKCKDFLDVVALIQKIAPVAEAEDHHPDLHLTNYRRLTIELSTHAIGGLSENDFILAAKIDQVLT